jgi:DNA-binding CsgD family transcriptional regulator
MSENHRLPQLLEIGGGIPVVDLSGEQVEPRGNRRQRTDRVRLNRRRQPRVLVPLPIEARQVDDRDAAANLEKLREAVILAHSTTVSLADAGEGERGGVRPPVQGPTADPEPASAEVALTEREREILRMVSAGATNADIARRLVISQSTVKSHVQNILRKLGVRNRTQAAARYFEP